MQVNLGSVNDNHAYVRRKNSSDGQKFDSASMPNFGKKSSADIMKEYIYKTDKKLDYFEKMNFLKGEAGTVIVTAIGTGCVAPIMIAFNPFAKAKPNATKKEQEENENMKKYTALRQPISALLSIAIQLSVLKPIDKMLESYVNKPSRSRWMFKNIDMATLPQDSYIGKHLLTEEDKVNYVIKELLEDEDTEKYIKANTAGKSEAEIDKFKNDFNAKSEAEQYKEVAKWKINSENLEKEWKKDKYKKVAKWKSSNVYQKEVARLMLADKEENRLMVNPGVANPEDTTEYLKTLTEGKPDAEKTKQEFNYTYLIVANYNSPTELKDVQDELGHIEKKNVRGEITRNNTVVLNKGKKLVSYFDFKLDELYKCQFSEIPLENNITDSITFNELRPGEFRVYRMV